MSEVIEDKSVRSAIAIALGMAKFRPSRHTTESDRICGEAADAVMNAFARAGWKVVSTRPYSGWGTADQFPDFGGPKRRRENCDG